MNAILNTIKYQILYNFKNKDNITIGDNNKNTVLLIEPRFAKHTWLILANAYNKLGNNWNYVFYCGKSFKTKWQSLLPNFIEVRALNHDNFENTRLYSDFCKTKGLWESLYGEYILTIQLDTWIMNISPYTIDFFTSLGKSYIGGNMSYTWGYFNKENIHHNIRNFNGGLSLRKKSDMIKIVELFPPLTTLDDRSSFLSEHEDVYFTTGCIKLNMPLCDDEQCSHFSLHGLYYDNYFGVHQPSTEVAEKIKKTHRFLKFLNPTLKL